MLQLVGVAAAIALSFGSAAAYAADIPPAEQGTLEAYAETNKTCTEWSDGCAVCLRHEDGTFACSLPGIACEPKGLICRVETKPSVTDPKTNKANEPPTPK